MSILADPDFTCLEALSPDYSPHLSATGLWQWLQDGAISGIFRFDSEESYDNMCDLMILLNEYEREIYDGAGAYGKIREFFTRRNFLKEHREKGQKIYDKLTMEDQCYLLKHSRELKTFLLTKGPKINLMEM